MTTTHSALITPIFTPAVTEQELLDIIHFAGTTPATVPEATNDEADAVRGAIAQLATSSAARAATELAMLLEDISTNGEPIGPAFLQVFDATYTRHLRQRLPVLAATPLPLVLFCRYCHILAIDSNG